MESDSLQGVLYTINDFNELVQEDLDGLVSEICSHVSGRRPSPKEVEAMKCSYEEVSISEIKRRIESGEYLYECDFIDGKGVSRLLGLYEQLTAQGIGCTLFDHGKPSDIQFLRNWVESCRGVAADTEIDMDREAEED